MGKEKKFSGKVILISVFQTAIFLKADFFKKSEKITFVFFSLVG